MSASKVKCGGCASQRTALKKAVKERNVRKVVVTAVDGVAMMAGLKEKPSAEQPIDPKPEPGPSPELNTKPATLRPSVSARLKQFRA